MGEIMSGKEQMEGWKQKVFHEFDHFFRNCFVQRDLQKMEDKICEDIYAVGISKKEKVHDRKKFLKILSDKEDEFYYIDEYRIEEFHCTCIQKDFFECCGTMIIRKKEKYKTNCHYKISYGASFIKEDGEMKLSTLFLSEAYLSLDFFLQLYEDQFSKNVEPQKRYNTVQTLFLNILNDAMHDSLTGVYNRKTGERGIKKILDIKTTYVFLLMDIDGFKEVNDNYGHQEGDNILKYVVGLFQESFRTTDIIFRLGGDEFVIFVYPCENLNVIEMKLEDMNQAYQRKIQKDYPKSQSSLSFGGVYSNTAYENQFEEIYQMSDEMLYKEKKHGGSGYSIKKILSKK